MLCTICARGGSKGVPNKNIRPFLGKPLIEHSIEQALLSGLFDHVAVSSDSEDILETARAAGADILIARPDELATDTSAKLPAIRHCALEAEARTGETFSVIVDLDATAPLRSIDDIKGSVALLGSTGAANVITGAPSHRSPYFNLVELDQNGVVHLSKTVPEGVARRQDAPRCYDMNASIYVFNREALMESDTIFNASTRLFEMPAERSVDIDSPLDWDIAEFLAARRRSLV